MTDIVQEAKTAEGSCPTCEDASVGEKNFEKYLEVTNRNVYLCNRFSLKKREADKRENERRFFEILDIVQKEKRVSEDRSARADQSVPEKTSQKV